MTVPKFQAESSLTWDNSKTNMCLKRTKLDDVTHENVRREKTG